MNINRNKIINTIINSFLINNRQCSSLIGKKLNETKIPYEYILKIIEDNKPFIIEKTKDFNNTFGKVAYIFKIIENYYSIIVNDIDSKFTTVNECEVK